MDKNQQKILSELVSKPGNNKCAECDLKNPEYASYNIGIFLCKSCALIHSKLGSHISAIKHLRFDNFENSQIERLAKVGNINAKLKWEEHLPNCYRKPNFNDHPNLIDHWIRAKYEQKQFSSLRSIQCFNTGYLVRFLLKRGKKKHQFRYRKFVLNEAEDTLTYYVHENKQPKAVLKISDLSFSFNTDKIGYSNSVQLVNYKNRSIRHFFLCHENIDIVINWYMELRCSKFQRLKKAFPKTCETEILKWLPTDFQKEGWGFKTGPRISDGFRKRWFTLDGRFLLYHDDPLDHSPKGFVFIGHASNGYSVHSGVLLISQSQEFPFTLQTPSRIYNLAAVTDTDRNDWISVLNKLIQTPLTTYDYERYSSMK